MANNYIFVVNTWKNAREAVNYNEFSNKFMQVIIWK